MSNWSRFKAAIIRVLPPILIMGIVFAVYWNTQDYPFQFDDYRNIVENKAVQLNEISWDGIVGSLKGTQIGHRPFSYLGLALGHRIHGLSPAGFRIVNIGIHALAAVALFRIILLLSAWGKEPGPSSTVAAALASLVWALHPIQSQAVTYIIQRMASQATCFYLWGVYSYLKYRATGGRPWAVGAIVAYGMSLGSKEFAVTFPLALVLVEMARNGWDMRHLRKPAPLLALLTIVSLIAGILFAGEGPAYRRVAISPLDQAFTFCRTTLFYVSLLFIPTSGRFSLDHEFAPSHSLIDPISTAPAVAAVLILIGVAFLVRKRSPLFTLAVGWFFLHLLIEGFAITTVLIYEHRAYLPSAGIAIGLAALIGSRTIHRGGAESAEKTRPQWRFLCGSARFYIGRKDVRSETGHYEDRGPQRQEKQGANYASMQRSVVWVACAGLAGFLAVQTRTQNEVWSSQVRLWENAVKHAPMRPRTWINLADSYYRAGEIEAAKDAVERALALDPAHPAPKALRLAVSIAREFLMMGRIEEAATLYRRAEEYSPEDVDVLNGLGAIDVERGDIDAGIARFGRAMELAPGHYEVTANLALALARKGESGKAVALFEEAISLAPERPEIYANLGNLYYEQLNEKREALEAYEKAMELGYEGVNRELIRRRIEALKDSE